jgi:ceramide glucosyltransferase
LPAVLAGWTMVLLLIFSAAVWALISHLSANFAVPKRPLPEMTLIKPVRGLDDAMRGGFESIFAADYEKNLQVIVALEDIADPAYPFVSRLAIDHPDRDITILLTGPSGDRMGKVHNMIGALARAKHPYIVFSDADSRITPRLLDETRLAFAEGCEAVFAFPYHPAGSGLGGFLFAIAFNQAFAPLVSLACRLGLPNFGAGAWMGCTKSVLERIGGLEKFAHAIADDFAISRAVSKLGVKTRLVSEPVFVEETGTAPAEAVVHLMKWGAIIHSCAPLGFLFLPLANPTLAACACWAALPQEYARFGPMLLTAVLIFRLISGWMIDFFAWKKTMRPWNYFGLAFIDLGVLAFWVLGFRSTIAWRGKRYRLFWGGLSEVLPS